MDRDTNLQYKNTNDNWNDMNTINSYKLLSSDTGWNVYGSDSNNTIYISSPNNVITKDLNSLGSSSNGLSDNDIIENPKPQYVDNSNLPYSSFVSISNIKNKISTSLTSKLESCELKKLKDHISQNEDNDFSISSDS